MLLNSLVGRPCSQGLGLQHKCIQGHGWREVDYGHGLASVLCPDLQLMLQKREISVTQFADCLPRGHDLSLILVPSSPDVLDSVWNVHARNPGKWQPFHKGSSDLVVRWEPSGRSHLLSSRGSAGQSSWGNPSMMGSSQTSLGKDTCGSTRAPAMFRPLPGQICFFL